MKTVVIAERVLTTEDRYILSLYTAQSIPLNGPVRIECDDTQCDALLSLLEALNIKKSTPIES